MSDAVATRKDIDEVLGVLQIFTHQMDERFNKVEKQIIDLNASHDKLINTIDTLVGRIDKYETEMTARDSQFEKLLLWARKVSEKTGIPIDNL